MSAEQLLSRLEKVRRTGTNRWRACCPLHAGENPSSLSIREDGDTLLVYCHACQGGAGAIAEFLGLDLAEFFPPQESCIKGRGPIAKPFMSRDVLEALDKDLRLAYVLFNDIAKGREPLDLNKEKASGAKDRIGRLISELDRAY